MLLYLISKKYKEFMILSVDLGRITRKQFEEIDNKYCSKLLTQTLMNMLINAQ